MKVRRVGGLLGRGAARRASSSSSPRPRRSASTASGPPRPTAPTRSPRSRGGGRARRRIKLGTSICQLSARTPTALAMAAMTLDHLSRRARPARHRGVRAPGRRGVVRPALPAPARAHARVRRDHARGRGARGAASTYDGAHYQLPAARRDGPRQAAALDDPPAASRRSRSCSAPRDRRTSRSPPRSPTAGSRCGSRPSPTPSTATRSPRGSRARVRAATPERRSRPRRPCCSSSTTTSRSPPRSSSRSLALYIGGMGAQRRELPPRRLRAHGLGRGLRGDPGRLPRGRPRRRRRARADGARRGRRPRRAGRQDRRGDRARRGARRASRR